MRAKITLDNAKLKSLIAGNPEALKDAIGTTAFEAEGHIKSNAPVDTGAFRNSINTSEVTALLFRIQDGVDYGIYLEYGTSRMAAQPTFRPALDRAEKQLKQKLSTIYKSF